MSITRKIHKKGTEMTRKWHVNVIVSFGRYCYNFVQRGEIMNAKELAEILSILNKIQIDNDPKLTELEKEIFKQFVDEIKNKVDR